MDMEMLFEPRTIAVTAIMYLFCMVVLWKFGSAFGQVLFMHKVMITIVALPVLLFITSWQLNR